MKKHSVKISKPLELMGINHEMDNALLYQQDMFENSLKIECPICGLHIESESIRHHFYEHGLNNYDILDKQLIENSKIICPICKTPNKKPLKGHMRSVHYELLNKFANGIYETPNTKMKREEEMKMKRKTKEKWKFKRIFVQGGLPSLGKKR